MSKILEIYLYAGVSGLAAVSLVTAIRRKHPLIAIVGLALSGLVLFLGMTSPFRLV
ncbi:MULTISPECIES: hypothetical protein [Cupriavidus]